MKIKKINLIALFFMIAITLPAQTVNRVTFFTLKGYPGVGMIRLFENPPRVPGYEINMEANYPMTVLVVDGAFAAANRVLINTLLDNTKASVEWVQANPAEAGRLVEKHELGLRAAVAREAIPVSNYVFIPAREARQDIESLFRVFLEFAPASIGGVMPGDGFYYRLR